MPSKEQERLREPYKTSVAPWRKWGPYVSERAWGTVREDYSADGDAWGYFPHDHARSRAYRWGEDGIAGICDRYQVLCFALAVWNGRDPILKERMFGCVGSEANHGEDVKEYYFYLDSTPTHSYMKFLYKYPQGEFPYEKLIHENRARRGGGPEYERPDAGAALRLPTLRGLALRGRGRHPALHLQRDELPAHLGAVRHEPQAFRQRRLPSIRRRK